MPLQSSTSKATLAAGLFVSALGSLGSAGIFAWNGAMPVLRSIGIKNTNSFKAFPYLLAGSSLLANSALGMNSVEEIKTSYAQAACAKDKAFFWLKMVFGWVSILSSAYTVYESLRTDTPHNLYSSLPDQYTAPIIAIFHFIVQGAVSAGGVNIVTYKDFFKNAALNKIEKTLLGGVAFGLAMISAASISATGAKNFIENEHRLNFSDIKWPFVMLLLTMNLFLLSKNILKSTEAIYSTAKCRNIRQIGILMLSAAIALPASTSFLGASRELIPTIINNERVISASEYLNWFIGFMFFTGILNLFFKSFGKNESPCVQDERTPLLSAPVSVETTFKTLSEIENASDAVITIDPSHKSATPVCNTMLDKSEAQEWHRVEEYLH